MYHTGIMPAADDARRALDRLFVRRPIADLDDLFRALKTRSRMTVFRRLSEVSYLTSYSHAGRFYTLHGIAQFDAAGLWRHQGVCFSRDGTLKQAVVRRVEQAESGRFHRELQDQLQVRVHNTLLDLVRQHRLGREPFAREYLYVAADRTRAAAQVAHRRKHAEHGAEIGAGGIREAVAPSVVIAVLLELIHGAELTLDARAISGRLRGRGIPASVEQVEGIFAAHGLEKKTARSRSRRSER